jgi:hypothetical protein
MPLDVSSVAAFSAQATRAIDAIPTTALGFVEAGADVLRSTDPYQNRTGRLRASTQAINVSDSPDAWEFELVMDTEYASYVQDLGFSRFDEVGAMTAENIGMFLLSDLGGALSG